MNKKLINRNSIVCSFITGLLCVIYFNRSEISNLFNAEASASWTGSIATASAAIIALWFGLGQNRKIEINEEKQAKVLKAAILPECMLLLQRLLITKESLIRLKKIPIGQGYDRRYLKYSTAIINIPALEITSNLFNELHRLSDKNGEYIASAYANLMLLRRNMKTITTYKPSIPMDDMVKKASEEALERTESIINYLRKIIDIPDEKLSTLINQLVDTVDVDGETLLYQGISTD